MLEDILNKAKNEIIILGTNTLIPELEESGEFFADKLTLEEELKISIFYESDTENFNQSLVIDTKQSINRTSFTLLNMHKNRIVGTTASSGLKNEVLSYIDKKNIENISQRVVLHQVNLRLPVYIIKVDDEVLYALVTHKLPEISDYILAEGKQKEDLLDYLAHYIGSDEGKKFLSKKGDELIQIYDKDSIPRGIVPRKAFFSTYYKRYSVWGLVFNRKGELLLHQRSSNTKDNRLKWDKSIGGHVDISDSSTYQTAQRELVEELFLPEAEHTRYLKEDLGDIINYGDLNFNKRPEKEFKNAFDKLKPTDWIMFRATDNKGRPLTVDRVSDREIINNQGMNELKKTIFISDVFIFIAPENHLDDEEEMKELVKLSEKTGAAENHKLLSVDKLREWIENEEQSLFTDDLIYINLEMRPLLEQYSSFISYIFKDSYE